MSFYALAQLAQELRDRLKAQDKRIKTLEEVVETLVQDVQDLQRG